MHGKMGFPDGTEVKKRPFNVEEARDSSSVPGLGRSTGEGNNCPLQYSCWRNHGQRSLVGYTPWDHKEVDPMRAHTVKKGASLKLPDTDNINSFLLPTFN